MPARPLADLRLVAGLGLMAGTMTMLVGWGCAQRPAGPASLAGPIPPRNVSLDTLAPSPRLIVGRIIAADAGQGFAFVEVAADAPAAAVASGTELIARTLAFRETARLETSAYLVGRILGTKVLAGQPTLGDEVVWLAP